MMPPYTTTRSARTLMRIVCACPAQQEWIPAVSLFAVFRGFHKVLARVFAAFLCTTIACAGCVSGRACVRYAPIRVSARGVVLRVLAMMAQPARRLGKRWRSTRPSARTCTTTSRILHPPSAAQPPMSCRPAHLEATRIRKTKPMPRWQLTPAPWPSCLSVCSR